MFSRTKCAFSGHDNVQQNLVQQSFSGLQGLRSFSNEWTSEVCLRAGMLNWTQ